MRIRWRWRRGALLLSTFALTTLGLAGLGVVAGGEFRLCLAAAVDMPGMTAGSCWSETDLADLTTRETGLGLELTHPQDLKEKSRVSTCRDYLARTRLGWYALTTRDMAAEGRLKEACAVLAVLTEAREPRYHLIGKSGGLGDLTRLGEEILPQLGEAGGRYTTASGRPPRTLAALVEGGECTVGRASDSELRLTYNGLDVVYRKLALADFDGDGYEDMLVGVAARASGGTQQMSDIIGLTQTSSGRRIELVSLSGLAP